MKQDILEQIANNAIEITEGHYIEKIEFNEEDDDFITIRCVGEDNLNEMVKHIKNFKGKIY